MAVGKLKFPAQSKFAAFSCVGFRRLLRVVEFCQDFAGGENVPCAQEGVKSFEDVVNRAIIQVVLMFAEELYVPQKLLTNRLVKVVADVFPRTGAVSERIPKENRDR